MYQKYQRTQQLMVMLNSILHVVYTGRLALYLGSFLSSLGMRLANLWGKRKRAWVCGYRQLLPSICMLSVWRALKRRSECLCSISAGEEECNVR